MFASKTDVFDAKESAQQFGWITQFNESQKPFHNLNLKTKSLCRLLKYLKIVLSKSQNHLLSPAQD